MTLGLPSATLNPSTTRSPTVQTYLTKQAGDITIVYYMHRNLGACHVAYYKADWSAL